MALEQHLDIPVSEEPRKPRLSMAPAPRPEEPRSSRRAWVALALVVLAVAGAVGSQMIDDDAVVEDGSSDAAEQARFNSSTRTTAEAEFRDSTTYRVIASEQSPCGAPVSSRLTRPRVNGRRPPTYARIA